MLRLLIDHSGIKKYFWTLTTLEFSCSDFSISMHIVSVKMMIFSFFFDRKGKKEEKDRIDE